MEGEAERGGRDEEVTMVDVLERQTAFEEDAHAVLGASDDRECTYKQGYVKRQALYACLTCSRSSDTSTSSSAPARRAGVCLACSLACHDRHELVELYTKRDFRCDCGGPAFAGRAACSFEAAGVARPANERNKYDHNFAGEYCACARPYPDPESTLDDDEMLQCVVCEDWLHGRHLGGAQPPPPHDEYAEMTCEACLDRNPFLRDYYVDLSVTCDSSMLEQSRVFGDSTVNETTMNESIDVEITSPHKENSKSGQNEAETGDSLPNQSTLEQKRADTADITSQCNGSSELGTNEAAPSSSPTNDDPKLSQNGATPMESNRNTELDQKEAISSDVTDITSQSNGKTESDQNEASEVTSQPNDNAELVKNEAVSSETTETMSQKNDNAEPGKNEAISSDNTEITSQSNDKTESDQNEAIPLSDATETSSQSNNPESNPNEAVSSLETEAIPASETDQNEKVDSSEATKMECAESNPNETTESVSSSEPAETKKRKPSSDSFEDEKTTAAKKSKPEVACRRPKSSESSHVRGAAFWPHDWRAKLCTCPTCLELYRALDVSFLLDPEDTVAHYEGLGKLKAASASSQYERGLEALSSLDRVQQINAITEYNRMKEKLLEFLQTFKEKKEVVREEDIKDFFAGMKPKREPDGVYFCR